MMPKSGPEPKFEPELWRTGPKFSSKFSHFAELNVAFDAAFKYIIISLNAFELGSNRTLLSFTHEFSTTRHCRRTCDFFLSVLRIPDCEKPTVAVPLHTHNG